MKIVAMDTLQLADIDWHALEDMGELIRYDVTPAELVAERAQGAPIVLVNKSKMTAQVIESLPELCYIGVLATGYDNVDLASASAHGVVVTNVPGYSSDSVAQLTFALLLEMCHHAGDHSRRVIDECRWSRQPYYSYWDHPLTELAGRTMGVVGLGRIGVRVAEIARAFGMRVLACSRTEKQIDQVNMVDFDTLLKESDVISLNCPLNNDTRGLMNSAAFQKMKRNALLINTSRGAVIVDADLRRALDEGLIAGAAVDVMTSEPPAEDNPLLGAKNIIITPHIAWATHAARERLLAIGTENLRVWLDGGSLNRVN